VRQHEVLQCFMTEFVIADCLTMRRLRLLCAVGTTLGQVTRDLYTVTVNITPVTPKEIKLSCSCPDWAEMCKHVAAVLYGVGARLDQLPELLFRLNQVDENDLIAKAGDSLRLGKKGPAATKVLGRGEDLSELFGLDIQQSG